MNDKQAHYQSGEYATLAAGESIPSDALEFKVRLNDDRTMAVFTVARVGDTGIVLDLPRANLAALISTLLTMHSMMKEAGQ